MCPLYVAGVIDVGVERNSSGLDGVIGSGGSDDAAEKLCELVEGRTALVDMAGRRLGVFGDLRDERADDGRDEVSLGRKVAVESADG